MEGRRKETTGQKYNAPPLHKAAITSMKDLKESTYEISNIWQLGN